MTVTITALTVEVMALKPRRLNRMSIGVFANITVIMNGLYFNPVELAKKHATSDGAIGHKMPSANILMLFFNNISWSRGYFFIINLCILDSVRTFDVKYITDSLKIIERRFNTNASVGLNIMMPIIKNAPLGINNTIRREAKIINVNAL